MNCGLFYLHSIPKEYSYLASHMAVELKEVSPIILVLGMCGERHPAEPAVREPDEPLCLTACFAFLCACCDDDRSGVTREAR